MKLQSWDPDLRTLVDRIERKSIDLQPDFQRQEVWSRAKQRKLIDTILRDWSIPPVHLVVTGTNVLEVLDGQQRLASVRDFFNDDFRVDGSIAPTDRNISSLNGLRFSQLPEDVRVQVEQYTLRCFRISEYRPEEPSELFYRLNQPVSLTAGEKRNALYGQSRAQLKELVGTFSELGNSRETLGFSNSRMSYDDILARLMFFLERGSFAVKASEAAISDRFRDEAGFSSAVLDTVNRAMMEFSERREQVDRLRLNKASLLSWLLFFSREGAQETDRNFLSRFESVVVEGDTIDLMRAARRVFVDRSSLRVTDVSSVVFRDVALWLAYRSTGRDEALPVDERPLWEIEELFRGGRRSSLAMIFDAVVVPESWARL
jgi:hypothetical protein